MTDDELLAAARRLNEEDIDMSDEQLEINRRFIELVGLWKDGYEAGVEAVFEQVEDITHGNYDAETFARRFSRPLKAS